MSEIMKKFTAIALTLALALTIAPATSVAVAATTEELEAQIEELQELVAELRAQLAGTTPSAPVATGEVPTVCEGMSFSRNLSLGSTGADVQCLQAMLNTDPATQLAVSGVGSAGQETEYFGNLTRAAVIKFQEKYASEVLTPIGLTAGTGFVGAQTKAKLNEMLTAAPTTPAVPGEDEEGVEGDEEDEEEEEGVEGDEEGDEEEDEDYTGVEGELTLKVTPSPINNQELAWGSENVGVMGLKLEAKHSPIKVQRIDVRFDNERPWDFINYLSIYDGDQALAGKAVNSANLTDIDDGDYVRSMRISGLNVTVPADSYKVLTIKVSNDNVPRKTESDGKLKIAVKGDDVRGVDGAKITQYNTGYAIREFYNADEAEGAKLEVKLNTNSPEEGIAITDEDNTTQHELLRFDVKATKNSAKITDLYFDTKGNATSDHITAYKLYDGSALLSSESASTGVGPTTLHFEDLEVEIAKDSTKTLRVEVEMNKNVDNVTSSISINASSTHITAESGNDEEVGFSGSTVTGDTIYFYKAAPVISNITTDITETVQDGVTTTQLAGTINFTLTAQGGDITASSGLISAQAATSGGTVTTAGATSSLIQVDGKTTADVIINSGTSKNVTISTVLTKGKDGDFYWFFVESLKYVYDGTTYTMEGELIKDLKTDAKSWKKTNL